MLVLHDSPQANHGVFFQQVGQKLIQMANRVTRFGRLFEIKAWQFQGLASSGVAWTTDSLLGSISNSVVHPEQKLNLYTARVLGDSPLARQTESRLEQFLHTQEWNDHDSYALVQWRRELESSASEENIKRGWGGTLDVEVLAHIFYAKHLHTPKHPWLRGTVERLEALRKYGVLAPHVALQLRDAYYFLRGVESGLRLMNTKLRHDLPRDPLEQSKLAFVLQLPDSKQLMESCDYYRTTIQGLSQFNFAKIRAQVLGAS
jgi:glutamate-ammonia-ligase adenylyltransferase